LRLRSLRERSHRGMSSGLSTSARTATLEEVRTAIWGAGAKEPGEYSPDCRLKPLRRHPIIRADDGVVELIARDLTAVVYTPSRDLERNTPYRWRVTARLGDESFVHGHSVAVALFRQRS